MSEALLAEARQARHRILTGTQEVEIAMADGRRVRYAASDLRRLEAYIGELERGLGLAPTVFRTRSRGVYF